MTAPNGEREELKKLLESVGVYQICGSDAKSGLYPSELSYYDLADAILSAGFHKLPKAEGWPEKIDLLDLPKGWSCIEKARWNNAIDACLSEHLAEKKAWEAKVKELEGVLECWHDVFGTTQLTHAEDRMRVAEELNKKWEARSRGILEIYEKYKDKPTALKDFDAWEEIKKFAEGGENEKTVRAWILFEDGEIRSTHESKEACEMSAIIHLAANNLLGCVKEYSFKPCTITYHVREKARGK